MNDFMNAVTNSQIATALVLIVVLLTYIAFKLSDDKKPSRKKSS